MNYICNKHGRVNLAYIFKILYVTLKITVFVASAIILKHEYLVKTQFIFYDRYLCKLLYLPMHNIYFYSININCVSIQYVYILHKKLLIGFCYIIYKIKL